MHRGLLARSIPDLELMRSDLTAAVELFRREDASRIVLFGAGFSRSALIAICQGQLKDRGTS
jgi:chemotaxis protein methyltransferase CheR